MKAPLQNLILIFNKCEFNSLKQIFLRNLSKELKIRESFQSFVSSVSGTPLSEAITRQTYYVNIFKILP